MKPIFIKLLVVAIVLVTLITTVSKELVRDEVKEGQRIERIYKDRQIESRRLYELRKESD